MWWLIPVGIGLAAAAIYSALQEEAYESRYRWEQQYHEVERTIEEHRQNIESHLYEARLICDFYQLIDLHYSSIKVADQAYMLLRDARRSLDAIGQALVNAKKQIAELSEERKKVKGKKERELIQEEIDGLRNLRRSLFPDKDKIKSEREHLQQEVARFNNITHQLKMIIRDRCGQRGEDWYNKLEARIAEKRRWR
jgi:hypothetical protein